MTVAKNRFVSLLVLLLPVAIPVLSRAQDEAFKEIQQRFEKFSSNSAQEKIYVHTDKNFYLAGEIIWFKVYYLDGATHQKLDLGAKWPILRF